MAKKNQEVAYVPFDQVSKIPAITQQTIQQIPPYEDRGVKFQGKYKTQQTETRYELKAQETRFYTLGIANGAFGSNLFPRSRPQTRFICTKVIIQMHDTNTHSLSLAQFRVADVKGTNGSTRFYFFPVEAAGVYTLDFTDSPRVFEGEQFDLYCQWSLGATEFIVVSLFGWEEQP